MQPLLRHRSRPERDHDVCDLSPKTIIKLEPAKSLDALIDRHRGVIAVPVRAHLIRNLTPELLIGFEPPTVSLAALAVRPPPARATVRAGRLYGSKAW